MARRLRALAGPHLAVAGVGGVWLVGNLLALTGSSPLAVGVVVAQVVALVGAAVLWLVVTRVESLPVARLVMLGWAAKMVGTVVRYVVLEGLYGGTGDASRYTFVGGVLAERFRRGDLAPYQPDRTLLGTQFMEMATGALFVFTRPTKIGGFFVFSAVGFVGLYLTFRAWRRAMPEADPRRLAAFGFLLPSMAFWPSSIGKEAVMVLGIGLVANGAGRQWTGARGGMALVAGGLGVTALVRPHITLLLVAALLGAVMVTRWDAVGSSDPLRKVASIGILVALLIASVVLANSFFEIDTSSGEQLSDVFEQTEERTDRGGSTFETSGPLLFPWTVVTVLFRPFPFEATNFQTALTSLETTFLLVVTIARRRVLGRLVRSCRQLPMVAFVLVFGALFVLAYSNFGNFGILARQRVQLYPLLVGLLCVPTTWPNLRLPGPGWSADRRGGREAAGLEAIRGARR